MPKSNIEAIRKYRSQTTTDQPDTLKSGDGGGIFDAMEQRVKTLEDGFQRIEPKLDGLIKDVAEIKGRLSGMPSTWQLLGMILAIMGASFAILRFGLAH